MFPDELAHSADSRMLLCVLDGLGDLPSPGHAETPLEAARTPNLDRLALGGSSGLFDPVAAGVTPGSGPGHLALFGYPPERYQVGRGVLSALGIDFELRPGDVAARFNFCMLDAHGNITDRRAGRLATDINRRLVARISERVRPPDGVKLFWATESEHRGLLVLRGENLSPRIADTDPQVQGQPPLPAAALCAEATTTADLVNGIIRQAMDALRTEANANGILLRGFAALPDWPSFPERFRVRACAVAKYPMYRGVARLIGMTVVGKYEELSEAPAILQSVWDRFDFFFLHFKDPDKAGEDGSFGRKVQAIEEFDRIVPALEMLGPQVMVVTGDHSTPVAMKQHSWHPVPVLLHAPGTMRPDAVTRFGERSALAGSLGQRPMSDLLSLMLAHAGRLVKFGA